MSDIRILTACGPEVTRYLDAVAALRIEVFREYPYLYDGNLDYERRYLATYARSPESFFVLAFDGDEVIGASTGLPMEDEGEEFQAPFREHGFDPAKIFYLGESVLRASYRGRGLGVRFFTEREAYAKSLHRFDYCVFCGVDRPDFHPRRPANYEPLDAFWAKRGYVKHPELQTTYSWKEIDEEHESPKSMTFRLKWIGS
jgi:GNAT superfamily N-acetyltransferase